MRPSPISRHMIARKVGVIEGFGAARAFRLHEAAWSSISTLPIAGWVEIWLPVGETGWDERGRAGENGNPRERGPASL